MFIATRELAPPSLRFATFGLVAVYSTDFKAVFVDIGKAAAASLSSLRMDVYNDLVSRLVRAGWSALARSLSVWLIAPDSWNRATYAKLIQRNLALVEKYSEFNWVIPTHYVDVDSTIAAAVRKATNHGNVYIGVGQVQAVRGSGIVKCSTQPLACAAWLSRILSEFNPGRVHLLGGSLRLLKYTREIINMHGDVEFTMDFQTWRRPLTSEAKRRCGAAPRGRECLLLFYREYLQALEEILNHQGKGIKIGN